LAPPLGSLRDVHVRHEYRPLWIWGALTIVAIVIAALLARC
jgi:hypothetical protein